MQLPPDLTSFDLNEASSLTSQRLRLLRWFVDQWPRLHERDHQLIIRSAPPEEPIDGDGITAIRAIVVVGDKAIEWWRTKGDPRFDLDTRSNGRYMCDRIYTWPSFMVRVRHWLVINGWEIERFLHDNADAPEYAALIANHNAAKATQSQRDRDWLVAAAHDADPALGEWIRAVFNEDLVAMERLTLEPGLPALGLQGNAVSDLCLAIRTADRPSIVVAKQAMRARIGILVFGVWQSRGQLTYSGPEESRRQAAEQRYGEFFVAVKAAALAFYTRRFEQWGTHALLSEIGNRLFTGLA